MNLVGGLRTNIGDYDFKYTFDNTRKNWIKSVFPHVETLVNIVANIPYNKYNYNGDIVYTYTGEIKEDNDEDVGYHPDNIKKFENKVIANRVIRANENNDLHYNFFGGICFELLNDAYPNVNLYDFVDPTSDIDINIYTSNFVNNPEKTKTTKDLMLKYIDSENSEFSELFHKINLVVNKTLEEPDLETYLNPYFMNISSFIFENMLSELNQRKLNFKNSVPFDIDEYDQIDPEVKNERLGYTVEDITNSNAKLIRYLDSDFKTLRIQIILKVVVDGETIIDHLLEFLLGVINPETTNNDDWKITIPEKENTKFESVLRVQIINISSLYTLIDDNLEAYKKREFEAQTEGPRRHKPINHITRIIYLLDLLKTYPDIYDSLNVTKKNSLSYSIINQIVPSYVYYKIINNEFILNNINTIDIIYAFYKLFVKLMQMTQIQIVRLVKKIQGTITPITDAEEQNYYNSLMSLFGINASPFRKIISSLTLQQSSKTQFNKKMKSRELDEVDRAEREAKREAEREAQREVEREVEQERLKKTYPESIFVNDNEINNNPSPFDLQDSDSKKPWYKNFGGKYKNKKTHRKPKKTYRKHRKTHKRHRKRTRRHRRH